MIKRTVLALLLALLTIPMMADGRRFTLVIDAGHGGHDFRAPGAVTNEKTLTLR